MFTVYPIQDSREAPSQKEMRLTLHLSQACPVLVYEDNFSLTDRVNCSEELTSPFFPPVEAARLGGIVGSKRVGRSSEDVVDLISWG